MCGLTAALSEQDQPMAPRALEKMRYRGTVTRSQGGIWHRRLPIVGLGAAGQQPVSVWEPEGPAIAFVGEILDYKEYDPEAKSDVELLVKQYKEMGEQALVGHDGFWSVLSVDRLEGCMEFFTDYLSQKPLYYRSDRTAVASELDAVRLYGPVSPDEIYFASVMKWGYCPEPSRTPYLEIKKTLPGECVWMDEWGRTKNKIVDPLYASPGPLKEEIIAAIKRRVLSSEVPVACLLSGGLDSSIVYSIAKRYGDVRPYFVYHLDEPNETELHNAARVAGGINNLTIVRAADVTVEEGLDYMQEPIDLGSLLPQVALSKAVQETVCLTGDGADEMFGGYTRSQRFDSQASDVFHELPCWHLPRLDRVMMRGTIETRSPFLARRVAEIALSLPRAERTGKKILKDMFRAELPEGIADQPKVPLRTAVIRDSREEVTRHMVELFKRKVWG